MQPRPYQGFFLIFLIRCFDVRKRPGSRSAFRSEIFCLRGDQEFWNDCVILVSVLVIV